MSEDIPSDDTRVEDVATKVQDVTTNSLQTASDYIRANPWTVVAGAAILGGIVGAILTRPKQPPSPSELLNQWLEEAGERLPSRKQLQATAKSAEFPCSLKELKKKLHLV